MNRVRDQETDGVEAADSESIRWRAWPCESRGGGTAPFDYLVGCLGSGPESPEIGRNELIAWLKAWESEKLIEWIAGCPHTRWTELTLPKLDQGSEHLVLFDDNSDEVVKITLKGVYGEYYEVISGKISQFDSTPAEYLLRMMWWEKLFSTAPNPRGMTEDGRIISRQKFIVGDAAPPQEKVDQFLFDAGASPVKQKCWLWKKVEEKSGFEVWIGDARSDNFVLADKGIIPIDIRIWGVPSPSKSDSI